MKRILFSLIALFLLGYLHAQIIPANKWTYIEAVSYTHLRAHETRR